MSFSKMFDLLREKECGKVVFVKCGHFYIAIEEDAVLLHELLDLKCTCFRNNTCKVGVPVNSIEKYIEKLKELKYSYTVYDYDKDKIELIKISEGKEKENYVKNKNINCLVCKGMSKYKEDKYLEAVNRLISEERKQYE